MDFTLHYQLSTIHYFMYDEPLEELQGLPRIIIDRLHRGGIRTILGAEEWLKDPKGLAMTRDQIDLLRNAVHNWKDGVDPGIQRSTTD